VGIAILRATGGGRGVEVAAAVGALVGVAVPPQDAARIAHAASSPTDRRIGHRVCVTFDLGDGVMLPGYDDPTVMPPYGGERFLPSVIGKGRSSTQWVLTKDTDLTIDYLDPYSIDRIAKVLALPETHFGIGKGLTTICVATPEGPKILNQALIDSVVSLDPGSPDPGKLGYGNTSETVGCK